MKKLFIFLGIIIIAGITIQFFIQKSNSEKQSQFQCADAAIKYFKSFSADNPIHSQFSYTDHWNGNLSKCFVLTETITALNTRHLEASALVDVIENKTYGLMGTLDGSFQSCQIFPNGNENSTPCNSKKEFDAYADRLMNQ